MFQGKQGLEGGKKQLHLSKEGEERRTDSNECKRVVYKLLEDGFQVVAGGGSSCAIGCGWDADLPEVIPKDAGLHHLHLQAAF